MNCCNHPDRPAVIQCKRCGKAYCEEEAELFIDGICPNCQNQDVNETWASADRDRINSANQTKEWYRSFLKKHLIIGIIIGVFTLFALISDGDLEKGSFLVNIILFPLMVIFGFAISAVWYYSGKIANNFFNMLTPDGWGCLMNPLIYFFIRFLIFMIIYLPVMLISPILFLYVLYKAYAKRA